MINIRKLSKRFGTHQALDSLSFNVPSGQVMCLLGANGAGKSTTLNLLLNFIEPDSGEIYIDGDSVLTSPEKTKQKLVYLPEQVNLYEEFNAIDNLNYLAKLSGHGASTAEIQNALSDTGLQESAWEQPLSSYSKGMRQKVGIAFAMLRDAKVLLLDEPTSGLDPSATLEFIRIIEKLAQRGAAILMVTHDLYCAHCLAHQIGIMNQGQLKALLTNDNLTLEALEQQYHHHINESDANLPSDKNAFPPSSHSNKPTIQTA